MTRIEGMIKHYSFSIYIREILLSVRSVIQTIPNIVQAHGGVPIAIGIKVERRPASRPVRPKRSEGGSFSAGWRWVYYSIIYLINLKPHP